MLKNREGKRVPEVTFRVRESNRWKDVTTDELFSGRTVLVFSLPGAFTPTCSSTHLPRYNELAPVFKANGIDAIVCVSVNDPFVMEEWAKDQEADNVILLQFVPRDGQLRRAVTVLKTRASRHAPDVREFKITAEGIVLDELSSDAAG